MELVYSALLLHQAKKPINEENIINVLKSVGLHPDHAKIKALVASLEGVNIDDILKQAAVTMAAPTKEEKKESKKEVEEEKKATEEASAGLSALFG